MSKQTHVLLGCHVCGNWEQFKQNPRISQGYLKTIAGAPELPVILNAFGKLLCYEMTMLFGAFFLQMLNLI